MAARQRDRFYSQSRWFKQVRKQVLYNAGYRCARCGADLHDAGKQAKCIMRYLLAMHPA